MGPKKAAGKKRKVRFTDSAREYFQENECESITIKLEQRGGG